jgi:hypothetical protein
MDMGMLALFERQTPDGPRVGWDEIVVGHDFGLLDPAEIQAWVRQRGPEGPRAQELVQTAATDRFEEQLWAVCAEATGSSPRPGGRRWAAAQDRWRLALLKDVLEAPLSAEALAVAVEAVYERVGCPEDMLGLWKRPSPWERRPGTADRKVIADFIGRNSRERVES